MLEMEVSLPQHRIPPYCFIYDWLRRLARKMADLHVREKKLARVALLSGPSVTIIILCYGFLGPGNRIYR